MRKRRSTTKFPGLYLKKLPPKRATQVEKTYQWIANRELYRRLQSKTNPKESVDTESTGQQIVDDQKQGDFFEIN